MSGHGDGCWSQIGDERRARGSASAAVALAVVPVAWYLARSHDPDPVPVAIVSLASLLGWSLVLDVRPAGRLVLDDPRRARPAIGPLLLAAATLVLDRSAVVAAALSLLACGLVAAATRAPAAAERVLGLAERIGEGVATVVRIVLVAPVALLTAIGWGAHRLVRHDVLASPTEPGSRWVTRIAEDATPTRLYSTAVVPRMGGGAATRRVAARTVATLATVVLVVLVALTVTRPRGLRPDQIVSATGGLATSPAVATVIDDDPAWATIVTEQGIFARHADFHPVTTYRYADFDGRLLHQVDGVRETWRPPPCGCPRVSVWLFGGSAAWGTYQRDDSTPGSQLAKAAWRRGVALDVTTFAQPGFTIGQGARLFGQLTTTEPPPDVALFYDGGNDVVQQAGRPFRGEPGSDPSELIDKVATERAESAFADGDVGLLESLLGGSPAPAPSSTLPPAAPSTIARAALTRYQRDIRLIDAMAAPLGVTTVFTWQPMALTSPLVASIPDARGDRALREAYALATEGLPPEVVDLTGIFDDVDEPVFADIFHTGTRGAAIVGERLDEVLRSRLEPETGR